MRDRPRETGFTLIEILVVVIVIGILASIALPIYLNQKRKGYDATAKSDVQHLAQAQEVYLIDHHEYGIAAALDTELVKVSDDVTLRVIDFTSAEGYCLAGQHARSANQWFWDSKAGGMQAKGATGCPTVYDTPGGPALSG